MSSLPSRAPVQRKSKGRQKVNMVKMANPSNLQVTFSKRRAGLFKKASELCTLSGAEAALVVFSPANKVYCFGHPNAQTVLDKIAVESPDNNVDQSGPNVTISSQVLMEAHRNSTLRQLNLELTQVESLLRAEKRIGEELEMIRKAGEMQRWLPGPLEKFNYEQLSLLKEAIMGFQKSFDEKMQRDMIDLNNSLMPPVTYANSDPGKNSNCDLWTFEGFNNPHPLHGSNNDFSHYGLELSGISDNVPLANNGEDDGMFRTMVSNPIDRQTMFFLGRDDGTLSSKLSMTNGVENEGVGASCGLNIFG